MVQTSSGPPPAAVPDTPPPAPAGPPPYPTSSDPVGELVQLGEEAKADFDAMRAPSSKSPMGQMAQEAHNALAIGGLALAAITYVTNYLHTKWGIGTGMLDSSLVQWGLGITAASKLVDSLSFTLTNLGRS